MNSLLFGVHIILTQLLVQRAYAFDAGDDAAALDEMVSACALIC
jgi:hypothetical protein